MKNLKIASMPKALALLAMVAAPTFAGSSAAADPAVEITPVSPYQIAGDLLHTPSNIKWEPYGKNKRAKVVESEGVPGGQAIQIEVKRKPRDPWDIRMKAEFDQDISSGDNIELYFWLRAESIQKGKETGKVEAVIGRNVKPHDTVIVHEILPTTEWKMYKVSGTAGTEFPSSESDMGFNIGLMKQTIEFGPFYAIKAPAETPE
jgi:hypothetical protein